MIHGLGAIESERQNRCREFVKANRQMRIDTGGASRFDVAGGIIKKAYLAGMATQLVDHQSEYSGIRLHQSTDVGREGDIRMF